MDGSKQGAGEARRKPLAELTDEELRVLAAEAKHADEEVQAIVCQVYRAALEERILIRYLLWKCPSGAVSGSCPGAAGIRGARGPARRPAAPGLSQPLTCNQTRASRPRDEEMDSAGSLG
jgi:hypothetical protein